MIGRIDWSSTEVLRETLVREFESLGLTNLDSLPAEQRAIFEQIVDIQSKLGRVMREAGYEDYHPNPVQERFHRLDTSCRWLLCANRVGKSVGIFQETKWYQRGIHPYRDVGRTGPIWVCGKTDEKVRNHIMPTLERVIGPEHIRRKVWSPRPRWEMTNDVPIFFKNYAQDAGTFASEHIRLVVFDEAPPWDIFEESWMRRGLEYRLEIIGGATLIEGTDSWIFRKVMDEGSRELLPDTSYTTGSLFENPYIPEDEKERIEKLWGKSKNTVSYRIRVLGEVLPVGEDAFFDLDTLYAWMKAAKEPEFRFHIGDGGRLIQTDDGILWVWRLPEAGHDYIVSCDPAEGKNVSHTSEDPEHDETAGAIFDRHRREFVGDFLSGKVRPDQTGELWLPAISNWYNDARTIIERNNHGHAVVEFARRKMQGRLYRPKLDRTDMAPHSDDGYGYLTTGSSRAYMIDIAKRSVDERLVKIHSRRALRQFGTFVKKPNGRVEHRDGSKDDLTIAHCLALVADVDLPVVRPLPDTSERAQLRAIALRRQEYDAKQWFRKIA